MSQGYTVYLITNSINDKVYVGRTKDYLARVSAHIGWATRGQKQHLSLYRDMHQLGAHNYQFSVIAQNLRLDEANNLEQEQIQKRKSNITEFGYNNTSGGNDHLDVVHLSVAIRSHRRALDPVGEGQKASAAAKLTAQNTDMVHKIHRAHKAHTTMGLSGMRENARKMHATLTTEDRKQNAVKANETLGAVGRQERSRKAMKTLGAEGLRARAKKTVAAQTPEQRSEARRKSWVTRRARAAQEGK